MSVIRVKRMLVFWMAFVLSSSLSAEASQNIRVAIAENLKTVTLTSATGLMVFGGTTGSRIRKEMTFASSSVGRNPVRVRSADAFTGVNGRTYRGWIELRKKNGRLLVINDLDIEEYLYGVIASEVPPSWESEALKAQAVAARTFALYQKRNAGNRPYHLLATVKSQVYNGGKSEQAKAVQAVKETKGIVIEYEGQVIPAFFHASCGGQTENASEVWNVDEPYLKGVDCECQEIGANGLWEKRIGTRAVESALKRLGYAVGAISGMNIETITPAGRVSRVSVISSRGAIIVAGEALRNALGTTVIPSTFFELEILDGEAVFSGRGSGHGVGMCQWGAKEMAEAGYDYASILEHYYPGTGLVRAD